MCKYNSGSDCHHEHDHHHHDEQHEGEFPLFSKKERLVRRSEVYIHHNNDHAGSYENLVNEAMEIGGEQAAQLIRIAAEFGTRQNENLEKALSILRSLQEESA